MFLCGLMWAESRYARFLSQSRNTELGALIYELPILCDVGIVYNPYNSLVYDAGGPLSCAQFCLG